MMVREAAACLSIVSFSGVGKIIRLDTSDGGIQKERLGIVTSQAL